MARGDESLHATIAVSGASGDIDSLWDWLRHEPRLRGRVNRRAEPAPEGAMGAGIGLLIALTSGAGAATGITMRKTLDTVASALSQWLRERERQRRREIKVEVARPDGSRVSVSLQGAAGSEALLRSVLEAACADLESKRELPAEAAGDASA